MQLRKSLLTTAMASLVAWALMHSGQATEVERQASELAFELADQDGDGVINEAELASDTAAGFAGLDANGDESLEGNELKPHDPADFDRVDADGDGRLSFREVMTNKLKVLDEADANGDGVLSKEEVVKYDAEH
jgi:Ca2+-binding EF-hand superfamily protein